MSVDIVVCRDHSSEHRHSLAQPILHKHLYTRDTDNYYYAICTSVYPKRSSFSCCRLNLSNGSSHCNNIPRTTGHKGTLTNDIASLHLIFVCIIAITPTKKTVAKKKLNYELSQIGIKSTKILQSDFPATIFEGSD